MDYFATCALGTEKALAFELKALGMREVRQSRGGVSFVGGAEDGMRACLHLRSAMRVLLPLQRKQVDQLDADGLYAFIRTVPWKDHLTASHTFAVEATGSTETLRHTGFMALRAKDAIADTMREQAGARPNVDARRPDVPVVVHVTRKEVSVSLDLCGQPLYRRGYRPPNAEAPLKETLAAALLILAGYTGEEPFCDPMAGTGTLVTEAAWIAMRRPPGLGRHFAFERWPGFAGERQSQWHRMLHQARTQQRVDGLPPLLARDRFAPALEVLTEGLRRAGVESVVKVEQGDVRKLDLSKDGGVVVTNPPYAERLGKPLQIMGLYRGMGEAAARWTGWKVHVLCGHPRFEECFGHAPERTVSLFNGPIPCTFFSYTMASSPDHALNVQGAT